MIMTTTREIPAGYEACGCCDGHGEIVVRVIPAVMYYADGTGSPAEEVCEPCEVCGGEGSTPIEPDEDFDAEPSDEDFDSDDSMDGDHESALASCGFGTDEDYGGFSDFDGE
jgi:hypothetical protein